MGKKTVPVSTIADLAEFLAPIPRHVLWVLLIDFVASWLYVEEPHRADVTALEIRDAILQEWEHLAQLRPLLIERPPLAAAVARAQARKDT